MRANEAAKIKLGAEARRKQIEKQKVAAAKKTLEKARKEILWLIMAKKFENTGNRLRTFQLKLKAKFHRTQTEHRKSQTTVEGSLRPNLDGFIERMPKKLRSLGVPWQVKQNPDSQPLISSNGHVREMVSSHYSKGQIQQ